MDALNLDHVIMGDMNLCYRKWAVTTDPKQRLIEKVKAAQVTLTLDQLVNTITRTHQVLDMVNHTLIDHVYTNCSTRLTPPTVIPVGDSDHLGIVVTKIISAGTAKASQIRMRKYKTTDIAATMLEDINSQDINGLVMAIQEPDEAAAVFAREVGHYLSKYAKVKTTLIKKSSKPFLSKDSKLLIHQMSQVWRRFKDTGDLLAHRRFKELAKAVKNSVHHDRNNWLGEDLGDRDSVKKARAKAKLLLGNTKTPVSTAINNNSEVVTEPKELAELFACHFDQKYKNTRAKCNMIPGTHPVQWVKQWLQSIQCVPPNFTLKKVSETTVLKHLKKLKSSKTLPSDDINGYGLHLVAPLLLPAIIHVVNLSIKTGTFAQVWKHQIVFPHHKKEERDEISNYRPVTGTVKLGLLTEHVVHKQLVDQFTSNGLFHPNHHRSIADHDTSTALIQANEFCLAAAEEKKLSASLLIDQTAAFDLVENEILLGKLEV